MAHIARVKGIQLVGGSERRGAGPPSWAVNPATGERLEPEFLDASDEDLATACNLAGEAFDSYRAIGLKKRAAFLEAIAGAILDLGDALIERCMAETGLPRERLEGERARTVGQLRLFAEVVRAGDFLAVRIDPAIPDRKPVRRPDLRLRNVPIGPVAVFGASNFPLAFSVAGGDTASALAAGCPVIVKAHPAHPGTSELVARAVQHAASTCAMPQGVFSLLFGAQRRVGQALAAHPAIKAVGFTGSRSGGTALMQIAAARSEPIPVYAEMSSINPVVLLPGALHDGAEDIARAFATSLTVGVGQFCTNPGLLIAMDSPGLDRFIAAARGAVLATSPGVMLSPDIHAAYSRGVEKVATHPKVAEIARAHASDGLKASAALFVASADDFLAHPDLHEEVFGPAGLLVRCRSEQDLVSALERLDGQLTTSLHVGAGDEALARLLLPICERKAGRIVFNGFGAGVEVAHAMVHGGPYPATSDGRSTSVGSLAIHRFLRPVCYQDAPDSLLPPELAVPDQE